MKFFRTKIVVLGALEIVDRFFSCRYFLGRLGGGVG